MANKSGPKPVAASERFFRHVSLQDATPGSDGVPHTGFTVWIARRDKDGYGTFQVDGRKMRANRFALEMKLGRKLKAGALALHTCDYPPCVDGRHLFEGSSESNAADRDRKGRARTPRGSSHGAAKLTEEVVRELRTRHNDGRETCTALAAEIGLSQSVVSEAVRGVTWGHVK